MRIYETQEATPPASEHGVHAWIARVAGMIGGARFVVHALPVNQKQIVSVYRDRICAECCIEDDNPEDVTIAIAAALARRARGDHV
jgi:hypothetical protein